MTAYWAVARMLVIVDAKTLLFLLCFLGVLVFMTNSLVTGSVFKLLVVTCAPSTKGSIVGAAKGYVGLGGGLYACLFQAVKTPKSHHVDFMLMSAVLVLLAASLPAIVLLPTDLETILELPSRDVDQTTTRHLKSLYFGLFLLACVVLLTTFMSLLGDGYDPHSQPPVESHQVVHSENVTSLSSFGRAFIVLMAWLLPIFGLLLLPSKSTIFHEENEGDTNDVVSNTRQTKNDQKLQEQSSSQGPTDENEEFKPLIKTHPSPALAYGTEITSSFHLPRSNVVFNRNSSSLLLLDMPNLTLLQMLQTSQAWLFAFVTIVRVGGGTMITNNLGQMVESLGLPVDTAPAALALFSVAQAISRVATGAVSDWALSWDWIRQNFVHHMARPDGDKYAMHLQLNGLPRPVFVLIASFAGACAHVFMSITSTRNWFLVGVCFSGAAFGMIWPLMVLVSAQEFGLLRWSGCFLTLPLPWQIVGEVFGTQNMGQNYMFYDGLSGAVGTLLLSKYVTQTVYEDHVFKAVDDSVMSDGRTCYGKGCFFGSHIIVAMLSLTCVFAGYMFYRSTRYIYAMKASA